MKVYISGKITGVAPEEAARHFNQAQAVLEQQGHEAINPLNNGFSATAGYATNMTIDILILLGCDAIYMLKGYTTSTGAMVELRVAQATGKAVLYQDNSDERKIEDIVAAIHDVCGVPPDELTKECRRTMNVYARMILAKCMLDRGADIDTIKRQLNKTYGSVLHYLRTFNNEVQTNKQFKELYNRINEMIINN